MTDFHSHILPGMDDGAKTVEESIAMLLKEKRDGVEIVVATPHFYLSENSVPQFLSRREKAYRSLLAAANGLKIPRILLGAEVYYTPSLTELPDLEKLCIEGTEYLLLEMPYQKFTSYLLDSVENLLMTRKLKYIMAHIERYLEMTGFDGVHQLMSQEVLGQINCSSLVNLFTRKDTMNLIQKGYVHLLGTDAHNMDKRPPLYGEAVQVVNKKMPPAVYGIFCENEKKVLQNEEIGNIL